MPRKITIPFTGGNSNTMAQPAPLAERRPSQSKGNRLSQFFSSSPKNKEQSPAKETLMAMQNNSAQSLAAPGAGLPSISVSSADLKTDEATTTLFQPTDSNEISLQKRRDAQFGPLLHPDHRYVSMHHGEPLAAPIIDEPPYYYVLTTYISYLLLLALGHIRDFFGKRFSKKALYKTLRANNGYAPLNDDFDSFYTRRLKLRIDDVFARTSTGVPGRFINLLDRVSVNFNESYNYTGTTTETLNMSSYNYLGFAQSEGPCADAVEECVRKYGLSFSSTRADSGNSDLVQEVEAEVAAFVGKPAAMVFSMGFVTNSSTFPALVSKGCLIISDELNHASIRLGARLSGAVIRSFAHNDMAELEAKLREAIAQGQPRTHRPWKKILVAVEGLYSMEGTMCDLPGILNLKDTYKFHLYVDEAHSVGALGPRGRGVCDYFGIDPSRVDILMGTLTKSFGANGGYIAAEKNIIDKLKSSNAATMLGEAPTPAVLMQIYASLKIITGDLVPGEGEERLQRIAFNSRYLRLGLKRLGMIVYGHDDSPIIPITLYNPAKIPAFSHEMLKRNISVVVVGYPATPLISSRARFCVSSAHNKDDLDRLLAACDEVSDILQLKFSTGIAGGQRALPEGVSAENRIIEQPRWSLEEVIESGAADAKLRLR
ncbi:serine palmitoyltransferase [Xylariaceae sp. FL1272]|nr:serine palmitoyltransferase [Xylariaceae sp. FL1272]